MKRVLAFSLVVIAVIIGGWYLFLGRPAEIRLQSLEKEISTEKKKMGTYRVALARFDERIKEYNQLHSTIVDYQVSFSGRDEVVALYHVLDSLCHRPGYHLDEITPSLEEVVRFLREWAQSDSTITIPIRIKISGNYRSLAQLVQEVEQSEYFSRLVFCRLSGSEDIYPQCALDVTFIAGLSNRLEMFDFE